MKSPFELELAVKWRQDQLLAEADAERLLAQVPRHPAPIRTRVALALVALAEWLSPDAAPAAPRLKRTLKPT